MPRDALKNVAVLTGNHTVAGRIEAFLAASESFEVDFLRGGPPGADEAHLVIVDVDSGADGIDRWIRHCEGRQLPVIVAGVEASRSHYTEHPWLGRPFTRTGLVELCQQVLGITERSAGAEPTEVPPAIEADDSVRQQPTVEIPEDVHPEVEESAEIHQQTTMRRTTEELLDVLELDGSASMILEIEELDEAAVGGTLVDDGRCRRIDPEQLVSPRSTGEIRGSGRQQRPQEPSGEEMSAISGEAGDDVTAVTTLAGGSGSDLSGVHQVSGLIAEHWDRIGLTARPADRAGRLQRILTAMLQEGVEGGLDELRRIPPVEGFSGRLEAMPIIELLHTVRDRRLRGRLEVGLETDSFVVYLDETTLQDIESIGEDTDGLLVDILYEQGALDERSYRRYVNLLGELRGESLEMKLRADSAVTDAELREAKTQRARRLLAKMCRSEEGTFAFIEISADSPQIWPTRGLELNIDALLLEFLRRRPPVNIEVALSAHDELMMDEQRISQLSPQVLTGREREVLELFRRRRSIQRARELIDGAGESFDEIIDRLLQLELVEKLGRASKQSTPRDRSSSQPETAQSKSDTPEEAEPTIDSSWNFKMIDDVDEIDSPKSTRMQFGSDESDESGKSTQMQFGEETD